MTGTDQLIATVVSFAATAGGGITALVKQARTAEAKINALVIRYEAMLNSVLNEVTKLEAAVTKAIPQPAPAPAAKKAPVAAKAPAVKKTTRRAGK